MFLLIFHVIHLRTIIRHAVCIHNHFGDNKVIPFPSRMTFQKAPLQTVGHFNILSVCQHVSLGARLPVSAA